MTEFNAIRSRARDDLVIITESGGEDVFLWEHSERVARWARQIARFPAIQEKAPSEEALIVAALYHDAGWAARVRDGETDRLEILLRPVPDSHYERGASIMERSLSGLVPAATLRRAADALRALDKRKVHLIDAQVIADAENLEEFCPLALWPTIRRGALEGKAVQAVVDTWHRRKEYQFWMARLNDSFRFAPVRELARARLEAYERTMAELEQHNEGEDIAAAVASSAHDPGDALTAT
ncbi:MAG: HD domain-containing protein [Phycisphaerae bacterium]